MNLEVAINYRAGDFLFSDLQQSYRKGGCDRRTEGQFQSRASTNEKTALTLISNAKTGDLWATSSALKQLRSTFKSCHENFTD